MIIRCPHCGNEYEIELDETVSEITIRCPNCRVPFIAKAKTKLSAPAVRVKGIQKEKTKTKSWKKETFLKVVLFIIATPIALLLLLFIIVGITDNNGMRENYKEWVDTDSIEEVVEVEEVDTAAAVNEDNFSSDYDNGDYKTYQSYGRDYYHIGYKMGYTAGFDRRYFSDNDIEEWCRTYWGIVADEEIDDESKYREFRRGLMSGVNRRRELEER